MIANAFATRRPLLKRGVGLGLWLALGGVLATTPGASGREDGWIRLFNGKDLDGWTPKIRGYAAGENFGDTFRVRDGVLKVAYDKYPDFGGRFGHLFFKGCDLGMM